MIFCGVEAKMAWLVLHVLYYSSVWKRNICFACKMLTEIQIYLLLPQGRLTSTLSSSYPWCLFQYFFVYFFVPHNIIKVMYMLTNNNSHLACSRHPFVPNALITHQRKHQCLHVCGQQEESSILSGLINHSSWEKYSIFIENFFVDLHNINVFITVVFYILVLQSSLHDKDVN